MQKILIIQTAFIGDVVLATALVEKLHHVYPSASIDFMVRKGNESLLNNHPFLKEVLVWNKKESKIRHLLQLLKQIRKRKYDAVINVQRFAATGFLTAFSNAKFTVGFNKNPFSFLFSKSVQHIISTAASPIHEIDRNQQLIASISDSVAAQPKLYPSSDDFESVKPLKTNPYIVVAPASVWFTKQYPAEKWIRFINKIEKEVTVYLIGAPGDSQLCEEIKTKTRHKNTVNLCGEYSFLQSAALQKDALMNYVNDSAPMHFASAMNAPVTAVYCSTLPSFGFGPLSDKSFVVEIEEALPCRPCGLHGLAACPLGHFDCAMKIREEQLLNTLE